MTITASELMALFGRAPEDARWVGSADSAEWFERVIYFADRNRKEAA